MPVNRAGFGVVVVGDVVKSRRHAGTGRWLERLCADLDAAYDGQLMGSFDFTQGDELQGLLQPSADPFVAVLCGALEPSSVAPRMRWAAVAGQVEPGRGPATRRSGSAFVDARVTIELARRRRETLLVRTGDPATDTLLEGTAPVLGSMLVRLTDRQRVMARLALVDGLRQSDIADRLRVTRATVSVAFARADVRSLARLLSAVRALWAAGVEKAQA